MAKKTNKKNQQNTESEKILFAFLATFLSILGFIIALIAKKDDKYVMFYAKQSLMIFIVYIIAAVIMIVPIIGWILGPIIYIIAVVLWIISWIFALTGKMKKVPIIGNYAEDLKI